MNKKCLITYFPSFLILLCYGLFYMTLGIAENFWEKISESYPQLLLSIFMVIFIPIFVSALAVFIISYLYPKEISKLSLNTISLLPAITYVLFLVGLIIFGKGSDYTTQLFCAFYGFFILPLAGLIIFTCMKLAIKLGVTISKKKNQIETINHSQV